MFKVVYINKNSFVSEFKKCTNIEDCFSIEPFKTSDRKWFIFSNEKSLYEWNVELNSWLKS